MQIKTKILIIEDNPNLLELYDMAFSMSEYQVYTALEGLDGITKAAHVQPEIILLDLMMPNMDGFEVLQALKKNTSLASKIFITSNLVDPKHIKRALKGGADMFIKKADFTPHQTVKVIEKYQSEHPILAPEGEDELPDHYRVLLIEDNEDQADLLRLALEQKQIDVAVAGNGEEGISQAVAERPHLILLDLLLPDISGFSVLEELRKTAHVSAPVIVTSQMENQKEHKQAESLGAAGFLNKSEYLPEQIAEKVIDYLEVELGL